jgi:hypothetical protein
MNDIYTAEIFQHDRWKLALNVQSSQLDRETDSTERGRKGENMGEKIIRTKLMGKAGMNRRR